MGNPQCVFAMDIPCRAGDIFSSVHLSISMINEWNVRHILFQCYIRRRLIILLEAPCFKVEDSCTYDGSCCNVIACRCSSDRCTENCKLILVSSSTCLTVHVKMCVSSQQKTPFEMYLRYIFLLSCLSHRLSFCGYPEKYQPGFRMTDTLSFRETFSRTFIREPSFDANLTFGDRLLVPHTNWAFIELARWT